jgi:hypothetical protein
LSEVIVYSVFRRLLQVTGKLIQFMGLLFLNFNVPRLHDLGYTEISDNLLIYAD